MDTILLYVGVMIFVFFSAFLSCAEMAFNSVNTAHLEHMEEKGNKLAKMALYVASQESSTLSTILVGNILSNTAASALVTLIAYGIAVDGTAIPYATAILTVIIIMFAEILPKIIAKRKPVLFSLICAYPIRIMMFILFPVVWVSTKLVKLISKLWNRGKVKEHTVTEDEFATIIDVVEDQGIIDEDQSDLLQSILEFPNTTAQEILTPRTELVSIDLDDDYNTNVDKILSSPYSRIPVYKEDIDSIIGILYTKRFLKESIDNDHVDLQSLVVEPLYVYKTAKVQQMIKEMQKRKTHVAVVVDEYGGTMGLVTLEDILEELVGDIWDESDEIDSDVQELEENTYLINGDMNIDDFFAEMEINKTEDNDDITTVSGWIVTLLDAFPTVNTTFNYQNLELTIKEIDGFRIIKVFIRKNQLPEVEEKN